ncbi:MAG: FtsW/RodA/SpoVE family cell cycle protein [Muribaculaceae bacterium]
MPEQDTIQPTAALPVTDDLKAQALAMRPKPRRDRYIWGIYLFLVAISIVEVFSASSREITAGNILGPLLKHVILLFGGFILMVVLQRVHYKRFYDWAWVIVVLCILAAVYTMFFGQRLNSAVRSFSFFGLFSVQPSELLKFSAALIIPRLLCKYRLEYRRGHEEEDLKYNQRLIYMVGGVVLVFSGLMINQGLTNAILLVLIALSAMLVGGVRWKAFFFITAVCAFLALGYGCYKMINAGQENDRTEMRIKRITDFLRDDKYLDKITDDNCQEQYSFIAQANGGILGVGPGNSRETARLPLAFSDYIYAIIIEDIGLLGGLFVLALYLCLLARAGRIAMKCKKAFPAMLVIGMAVFITFQALMHMAIVTGAAPVSGQPLPLISKGGSSVIVTSIALGVMLSVSRFAARKGIKQEVRDNLYSLSDNEMPDNPTQL